MKLSKEELQYAVRYHAGTLRETELAVQGAMESFEDRISSPDPEYDRLVFDIDKAALELKRARLARVQYCRSKLEER